MLQAGCWVSAVVLQQSATLVNLNPADSVSPAIELLRVVPNNRPFRKSWRMSLTHHPEHKTGRINYFVYSSSWRYLQQYLARGCHTSLLCVSRRSLSPWYTLNPWSCCAS